jgi:signal transduction histidine kinase
MKWKTVALVALAIFSAGEIVWRMSAGMMEVPVGCCALFAVAVSVFMPRFPLRTSIMVAAMWIALCLAVDSVPIGLTVLMLVSLSVIAFSNMAAAGVCAILAMIVWLMVCEGVTPILHDSSGSSSDTASIPNAQPNWQDYADGNEEGMYGVGGVDGMMPDAQGSSGVEWHIMTVLCVMPVGFVLGGYCMRNRYDKQLERVRMEQRRRHVRAARGIHDHVSNDLAYLVLRIDSDIAQGNDLNDVELRELRSIAAKALANTHQVIDLIERDAQSEDSTSVRPFVSANKKDGRNATMLKRKLRDISERMERRLAKLGCHGRTIISGEGEISSDDLITGFMEELYGNIIKHADFSQEYVLTASIEDDVVHMALIDTPTECRSDLKHGSGLTRYRNLIEDRGGRMEITESPEEWSLYAIIPTRPNRNI